MATKPILHWSALAYLTLGALFKTRKRQVHQQTESDVSVSWRQMETSRQPWQETMLFFDNGRVGQALQADGIHSLAGKGRNLPGDSISQTPIPPPDVARCCRSTDQARLGAIIGL